jgi:hypothetical protein
VSTFADILEFFDSVEDLGREAVAATDHLNAYVTVWRSCQFRVKVIEKALHRRSNVGPGRGTFPIVGGKRA